jgi:hypothetical protein
MLTVQIMVKPNGLLVTVSLHALLHFHFRPIHVVVYHGPS